MAKSPILVGVDFTASSHRAVEEAGRVARRLGARLFLVHVFVPSPLVPLDLTAADEAREKLAGMALAAARQGIDAIPHVRIGGAVTGMLAMIRQLQPSLVVLGRRCGGQVAEELARKSPAPLLVVPARQAVAQEQERQAA